MKKLMITAALAAVMLTACKKDQPAQPAPPPTPPPVENPAPPPAPEPQTQVKTETKTETKVENPDGTSVSVNKNGITVKNKRGENVNNIKLNKDNSEIEIKTD